MEIKQEVTDLSSDPYSDSYLIKSEVNHVYQPNVITKLKDEVIPTTTSSITANTKWSPGRWQDATRKSAFQPYKSSKCTVLTNLQRGNTQTETPIPHDSDINFHTRAGQGEITVHDIKNEPSVDIVDSNGLTALQWAAAYGQMTAIIRLIANGAKVNYVGQDGETSLLLAAAGGHHDVVRILLNEGALVNHTDHVIFNSKFFIIFYNLGNLHPFSIT